MKETGVEVEPPPVARFREHLLSGEWREVRVSAATESSEFLIFFCIKIINYRAFLFARMRT